MNRKSVALVTLILFTLFSCQLSITNVSRKSYITTVVKTHEIPSRDRESVKVLGPVTIDNKWIEFKAESGRIILNTIEGRVVDETGRRTKWKILYHGGRAVSRCHRPGI
jgi:hypothetical protein